jgi:hypothetical protein
MSVDWAPIVQTLVEVVATALGVVAMALANKAITVFETRTNVQLTEQQRATVLGAVQTAAGAVKLELAKGGMALTDVHAASPQINAITTEATKGVQESVAALGVTPEGLAKMVVGKVGNELPTTETTAGDVSVKTAAAPAQPIALVRKDS